MRCACCGRAINPANAYTVRREKSGSSGMRWTEVATYGPVCAVRLGLMKQSPPMTRKPSRFAIFSKTNPVRVEDGQIDIFGALSA